VKGIGCMIKKVNKNKSYTQSFIYLNLKPHLCATRFELML
jgi:hypothetical protein